MVLYRLSLLALCAGSSLIASDLLQNAELNDIYSKNIKKTTDLILNEIKAKPELYTFTTKDSASTNWEAALPRLNKFIASQPSLDPALKNFFSQKYETLYMAEYSLISQLRSALYTAEQQAALFNKKTKEEASLFQRLKSKVKGDEKYGSQTQKDASYTQLGAEHKRLQALLQKVETIKSETSSMKSKAVAGSIEKQILVTFEYYLVSMLAIIRTAMIKINENF